MTDIEQGGSGTVAITWDGSGPGSTPVGYPSYGWRLTTPDGAVPSLTVAQSGQTVDGYTVVVANTSSAVVTVRSGAGSPVADYILTVGVTSAYGTPPSTPQVNGPLVYNYRGTFSVVPSSGGGDGGEGGCPPPNAPGVPTSPDMCEGAQVSLSVPALSGVLGYAWQRDGAQIATTSLPAFVDTGVTIGTQYSFTATAFNACGESDPSPAYLRTPCARAEEPDPRPDDPTTNSCDCCHWERAESPLAGPWARIAPPCDC